MLSRSGLELNEIWCKQSALAEADDRIRELERRHQAEPGDEGIRHRLAAEHRRTGNHDAADAVHLGHHARVFADASKRAHTAEKKVREEYAKHGNSSDETEAEWDKAHEAMGDAHGSLLRHTGNALRERGDANPVNKAGKTSDRFRVIMAHGAKHLPKTDNWDHEHSLLSHWHEAHQPGQAVKGGRQHMRVDSAAARHSLVHSLVSRNPHLRVAHHENDGEHHVTVHLAPKSHEPLHHEGGHVSGTEGAATLHTNAENYLKQNPPHGDGKKAY